MNITGMKDDSVDVVRQEGLNLDFKIFVEKADKLKAAGIVEGVRSGLEICYRIVDEDIKKIVGVITKDIDLNILK